MNTRTRLAVFAVAVAAAIGVGAAAGAALGPVGPNAPAEHMPTDHNMPVGG
jgi:hypothetical protein